MSLSKKPSVDSGNLSMVTNTANTVKAAFVMIAGFIVASFFRESQVTRDKRIAAYWQGRDVLYSLGLLITPDEAQVILDGGRVDIGETLDVLVDGKQRSLPLAPDAQYLAKSNFFRWGCIVCGSAHGSGVGNSRSQNAKLLAETYFYYDAVTQTLVSISYKGESSCYNKYFAHEAKRRFVAPDAPVDVTPPTPPTKPEKPKKA